MTNKYPHRILHTMLRVSNLDQSINFYTQHLGMKLLRQADYQDGRFTLAFLGYHDESEAAVLELTYNWDKNSYQHGEAYGHLALATRNLQDMCDQLKAAGVNFTRQPGPMAFDANEIIAFIEDPDGYKIELIESP